MDTQLSNLSIEVHRLHADLCSALSDPTRILILYLLADGPHPVNELTKKLDTTQTTTSRHLKILRERGLVQAVRQAQTIIYSLSDRRIITALDILRDVLRDSLTNRANMVV